MTDITSKAEANAEPRPKGEATGSYMRVCGFWLFCGGVVTAAIIALNLVRYPTPIWIFPAELLCAIVVGLGSFMWMLGAIEERLIEIRDALRHPRA